MSIEQCKAMLTGDTLVLENSRMRRVFLWNHGHLVSRRIEDLRTGRVWTLAGPKPDCELPDQNFEPAGETLETTRCAATAVSFEHLQVDCTYRLAGLWIRRRFRIYPDCPAIACDFYLKGKPRSNWRSGDVGVAQLANIEDDAAARQGRIQATVMERIATAGRHLKMTCVQFFDLTDQRNNLVTTRTIQPYRQETRLTGNLLLVADVLEPQGLFILKEAPCSDMQVAWPGCDFVCTVKETQVVGLGVPPEDLRAEEWTLCYGFVTGVAGRDEYSLLGALREYQSNLRVHKPGRDHSIMLNTWGDRSATAKIGERFCLDELEAGSRLGVSHFQIDDGWQVGETYKPAGQPSPSGLPGRMDADYDARQFWAIDAKRFPAGLGPVVEQAKRAGVELCLWFARGARAGGGPGEEAHVRREAAGHGVEGRLCDGAGD